MINVSLHVCYRSLTIPNNTSVELDNGLGSIGSIMGNGARRDSEPARLLEMLGLEDGPPIPPYKSVKIIRCVSFCFNNASRWEVRICAVACSLKRDACPRDKDDEGDVEGDTDTDEWADSWYWVSILSGRSE